MRFGIARRVQSKSRFQGSLEGWENKTVIPNWHIAGEENSVISRVRFQGKRSAHLEKPKETTSTHEDEKSGESPPKPAYQVGDNVVARRVANAYCFRRRFLTRKTFKAYHTGEEKSRELRPHRASLILSQVRQTVCGRGIALTLEDVSPSTKIPEHCAVRYGIYNRIPVIP